MREMIPDLAPAGETAQHKVGQGEDSVIAIEPSAVGGNQGWTRPSVKTRSSMRALN